MKHQLRQYGWIIGIVLAGSAAPATAQQAMSPQLAKLAAADDPMKADVLYTVPGIKRIITDALIESLTKAAAQPDQDARLQTLDAVCEFHFTRLADPVKTLLGDDRVLVRTAAVKAAADLNLADTAPTMRPWLTSVRPESPEQIDLLRQVDRALVRFADREAEKIWLARVRDTQAPVSLRVSALQALADMHVGFPPQVIAVAVDVGEPAQVRLAAADVIVTCGHRVGFDRDGKLFAPYDKLLSGSRIDRLVAARMLSGEQIPAALPLLQRAAGDAEPAVQAIALEELKRRGPAALTPPIIEASLRSPDPKVRRIAIEGLVLHPVKQSVQLAGESTDDPHPTNRDTARATMVALDKTEIGPEVRAWLRQTSRALPALDADQQKIQWGKAEQTALLARDLQERSVAETLTKYLTYPRQEVIVAAIKAIRLLDVPATHEAVLSLVKLIMDSFDSKEIYQDPGLAIARQAIMTLGVWRMKEADATLRRALPKLHPLGTGRPMAVWALGLIHEGAYDPQLGKALMGRMDDTNGLIPESDDVRAASAIALGRMKGEQALGTLRKHMGDGETMEIQYASQWAVEHITGKPAPLPPAPSVDLVVPFLGPLRE